ncbi:bacterial Ig-like domain-containing protein [Enterococcus gilvus]|uniref:bacterial Ig-like domain-containing protein n=1 Tax=Enterococcus gilvus TaxID=160453 RepID=UPI0028D6F25F|nr:bacterial Ig-like domain-containing protein [Enterococcus gilvus]
MKKKSLVVISTAILASNTVLPATLTSAEQATPIEQKDLENAKENLESETDNQILNSMTKTENTTSSESIEETQESEEASSSEEEKESTTESEDQKTEESSTSTSESIEKEDVEKKAKKAEAKLNSVTAGINVTDKFQTYIDPITKVGPTELTVSVPISISQADLEGVKVEIPYDFTPSTDNPTFKNFTMTDPIFSLIEPDAPSMDSIVESYENKPDENKLVIHLKKTTTTVETLNLRFEFNQDYSAKIPANQIIWNNLKATVKDAEEETISESDAKSVKSSAIDGMGVSLNYGSPGNQEYVSGPIDMTLVLSNRNNLYSLLDTTKNNRIYVEIPMGTTMSTGEVNYFENKKYTHEDDPIIPEGYIRYYRVLTDDNKTFNYWNTRGNPNDNSRYAEPTFIVPETIDSGGKFHITYGEIYTKINGEEKEKVTRRDFIKQEQKEWAVFTGNKSHQENAGYSCIVNTSVPSSTSRSITTFGLTKFGYDWTFKNIGKRDIKNSDFVIYQKNTGSEKLNFKSFGVRGFTQTSEIAQTYYKVTFKIKNALTGEIREINNPPKAGTFNAMLPVLSENEYIDKVHVTPMGTDGNTEGHMSSLNGIGVSYSAKNWEEGKWPDGTKIPTNRNSKVLMGATKYYDDETNNQPAKPTVIEQNTGEFFYTPGQTTDARAQFVSSNAQDRKPGETIDFSINGFNESEALGDWVNPEIVVSIPKVLEIEGSNEYKDFIDEKNKITYEDSVKVSLVSSDDEYNYYKFSTNNIGYRNNAKLSFSIPLKFKVLSGTPVGRYPIQAVTASHNEPSFVQLKKSANNLPNDLAQKMGYDNAKPSSYSAYTTGNSDLNVVYATKLNGATAGRKKATEDWSNVTNFAVEKGGSPQMKATVQNTGNTNFSSVRLYDILPSSTDGRGSTGNVSFDGLQSVDGATVYYTTKPVSDLPNYETNLQDWTAAQLVSYGFTTNKPANASDTTAIFIDFGNKVVAPNSNLDTVMDFLIPNADNQKAINQFQYSAKEEGSGTTLNAKSDSIVFSTEVAQLNFEENLPNYLAEGVEHASNMPENQGELLDVDGNGSVTIPEDAPTLAGYDFVEWVDKEDKTAKYQPGDVIDFTKSSSKTTIDLNAVWKAKKVRINYNENFGNTPKEVKKDYSFGDTVDLTEVPTPTRTGYEFIGWSSASAATDKDFNDGTRISFTSEKTVYAVWKVNRYKVSFDGNAGTGAMTDLEMSYDVEKNLPKNTFERNGYLFQGWSTKKTGTVEYKDQAAVKNLSSKANDTISLYAIWKVDQTEIKVKDSTIHVGDAWTPEDTFVSAKDEDGKAVTFDKVTAPKADAVDTMTIGDYEVTYSYNGKEAKATIHVVANQEALKVKDVTIYEGDDWSAADNFVNAADKDGNGISFDKVKTSGASDVNTNKEGTYEVTYQYGNQTQVGKVIVLKNQTSITTKDSTIYVGGSWNPADNFVSAIDKDGSAVDFSQVTGPANNAVDVSTIGEYTLTYTLNGKEAKATVHVVADQETLTVRDVTIYEGEAWKAADNFVSATTKDGGDVAFKDVAVSGADAVNVNQVGDYEVSYTYGSQKTTGKVTVLKNQTSIEAKDSTIYTNSSWTPADNFVRATDKTGANVDFSQIIPPAADAVDVTQAGDYEIVYHYNGKEAKATVRVVANQETLTVKDVTIYEGETWTAADNFVGATTKDGEAVTFDKIDVSNADTVTTTKAGTYEVTYKYGEQQVFGKVIVLKNQTSIEAKDSTIYQGSPWEPADNFVRATDKTGAAVDFDQVTAPAVDAVDPTKIGEYKITYSYNGKETTVTVHVVRNQETLTVKDVTLYEGDDWTAQDNFIQATQKSGDAVPFSKIQVKGAETVDTEKAGIYEVTYLYGNQEAIGKVYVLENQASITAKDSTIYQGSTWKPVDNFVGATDKTGAALSFDKINAPKAEGVDTTKIGDYTVTYRNNKKEAKAVVHVVKDQETLTLKDITIYEGDVWKAEDNFVGATTKDGKAVSFEKVKVTGAENVNNKKAGTYELTFTQGGISQKAKVIVLKDKSSISVKDSILYVGDKWEAKDNFVSATDRHGTKVDLSDLAVTGEVDTQKAGTYEVKYSFDTAEKASRAGGRQIESSLSTLAKVKVLEKKTPPNKKNESPSSTFTGERSLPNSYRTVTSAYKTYPKTGENHSTAPIIAGGSLISFASLIAWFRNKRKRS